MPRGHGTSNQPTRIASKTVSDGKVGASPGRPFGTQPASIPTNRPAGK